MTLSDLRKSDHGVYECVVSNEVATIVARTALLIERTTPHAPTNVTVTSSETFAVTIAWHPGFSGCSSCQQTYKIRFVIAQCGHPTFPQVQPQMITQPLILLSIGHGNREHETSCEKEGAWGVLLHSCLSQTWTDYLIKRSKRPLLEKVA